jgi:hypothetical protein
MGNTLKYDVFDTFLEERKINTNVSIGITKHGESIRINNNGSSQFYLLVRKKYIYPSKLELYFEEDIVLIIERLNIVTNNMFELKYIIVSDRMSTTGIIPEYKKIGKQAPVLDLIYSLTAGI